MVLTPCKAEVPWAQIKGIIFDKDGTLVDFYPTWIPLYHLALRELARRAPLAAGLDATFAQLLGISGFTDGQRLNPDSPLVHSDPETILRLWGSVLGVHQVDVLEGWVAPVFAAHYLQHLRTPCDLPALCRWLSERKLALALVTSDSQHYGDAAVKALGIAPWIMPVIGSDQGLAAKPDAAMVHACLQRWQLDATRIAVIGDHPKDLQMGRGAGAGRVIGVLSGASSAAELAPWCDEIWPHIGYLRSVLAQV